MKISKSESGEPSVQGAGSPPPAKKLIRGLLPLVLLLIGVVAGVVIIKTAPRPRKAPPPKKPPQVRVQEIRLSDEQVILSAMGTVMPARRLVLKSQVGGEIVALHPGFLEGGFIPQGETILRIDPADYELAVAGAESRVAEARYQLKLELGHQAVAQREWQLLSGGRPVTDLERELALRRPHLDQARAHLKAAEAELERARLDLSRTRLKAPFNALVLSRQVVLGSRIAVQEILAELVDTDEYWVRVSVPVDRLGWFAAPSHPEEAGARVLIRNGARDRAGKVIRLLGDLEQEGRMARVLVGVPDPLGLGTTPGVSPPLLLGQYVRVAIQGNQVSQVARIPRTALREDGLVWTLDQEERLRPRKVTVVWREQETLLVRGELRPKERLVVTDLAAPQAGMPVQVVADVPDGAAPAANLLEGSGHGR